MGLLQHQHFPTFLQDKLIKLCLHKTFAQVWTGKHLSDTIPIQNGPKKGGAAKPTFPNFSSG